MGFPGDSVVKNLPVKAGDVDLNPWVRSTPWRRKWQPTSVFSPGRSLAGFSLQDCKGVRHDLATKQAKCQRADVFYVKRENFLNDCVLFRTHSLSNPVHTGLSTKYHFKTKSHQGSNLLDAIGFLSGSVFIIQLCPLGFFIFQAVFPADSPRLISSPCGRNSPLFPEVPAEGGQELTACLSSHHPLECLGTEAEQPPWFPSIWWGPCWDQGPGPNLPSRCQTSLPRDSAKTLPQSLRFCFQRLRSLTYPEVLMTAWILPHLTVSFSSYMPSVRCWLLYQFLVAAVTNYHKTGGLKQCKCSILEVTSPKWGYQAT